jgi:hypothetical protein
MKLSFSLKINNFPKDYKKQKMKNEKVDETTKESFRQLIKFNKNYLVACIRRTALTSLSISSVVL